VTASTVQDQLRELESSAGSNAVGFIQAGTGAVVRTAQDKLREYVSPEDFGAVGDGVVDDSDAIEAAINSGAMRVYFASRQYKITRPISLYTSGVELIGRGARITQATLNTHGLVVGQTLAGAYTQVSDIEIHGIDFFGSDNGQGSSYSCALLVRQPATNPYVSYGGCIRINIERCLFDGWCFGVSATAATELRCNANTFRNMFYHAPLNAGGYGIATQTCFDISITSNKFMAVAKSDPLTTTDRHAIYISADPTRTYDENNVCRRVLISGNDFDWGAVHKVTGAEIAVAIRGAFDVRVEGNSFYAGFGGVVYNSENGPGEGVVIANNTFRNSQTNGTNEQGCINIFRGSGSYTVKRVSVVGNTCEINGENGFGIQLSGVDGAVVESNVVTSPIWVAYGILLNTACSNVTVGPNTLALYRANALTFSGAGSGNITVHRQQINFASGIGVPYRFFAFPSGLKFAFARTFSVVANGSGSVTLAAGEASPASSVASDANGFVVTFDGSVNVNAIGISALSQASLVGQVYLRSKGSGTITFGVTNHSGAPLPADTNAYTIQISIPY